MLSGPVDAVSADGRHCDDCRCGDDPTETPPCDLRARPDGITYNFYGSVDARGGTFGVANLDGRGSRQGSRQSSGKLRETEVLETVSNYVRPPTFSEAATSLRHHHLVVLAGTRGSGRRAGAVALLREVTEGPIVILPPGVTARDLAEWHYLDHYGYLVLDSAGLGPDPGPDLVEAGVEERVRRAGTHLVVTTTRSAGQPASSEAPPLAWERPPVAEVLRTHLAGDRSVADVDSLVDFLVPRVPEDCTLRWLGSLAGMVREGTDPASALRTLEERRHADRLFAQARSRHETVELTVAAFLPGSSGPVYRSQLARLGQALANHRPGRRGRWLHADPPRTDRPRRQPAAEGHLRGGHSRSAEETGLGSLQKPYQQSVLARIWDTSESWFLAGVREWIDGLVVEAASPAVVPALAALARSHFNQVSECFLEPWSAGRLGWEGKIAASQLLWCLCREQRMAPRALRTAIQWAGSGDRDRRDTAVIAFSGELGISFPAEAARQLWALLTDVDDPPRGSFAALGRLFAALVDRVGDAGAVLTRLETERTRASQVIGPSRVHDLTIEATLAVLAAQSHRTARPAVVDLLENEPSWLGLVVRLWADLIRSEAAGNDGVAALWGAAAALWRVDQHLSRVDELGKALAGTLTEAERLRLGAALVRLVAGRCSGDRSTAGVLAALLAALAARLDSTRVAAA